MTSSADFPNLPSVWLHELTWEEVASYLRTRDTIMVPFGTTEQHGPAGSLGLDGYVAIASCRRCGAKKAGVLSAPPLWYGDSSHHLGFPGTISLRTETLMQVVYDIVRSLARHGFRRILLINGHKWTNLAGADQRCPQHPRIRAARRADGGGRSDVSGARHREHNQARQRAPRGRAGSLAGAVQVSAHDQDGEIVGRRV